MLVGYFFVYFCPCGILSSIVACSVAVLLFLHSHSGDEYVVSNDLQYSRLFSPWNNLTGDLLIHILQFKLRIVPQTVLYVHFSRPVLTNAHSLLFVVRDTNLL